MSVALDPDRLLQISRRFPGRWLQGYVRGKLKSDPVYAGAAAQTGTHPAPVLDIGCGIGLFAQYLHAIGRGGAYLGIDVDAHKLGIAQQAAPEGGEFRFELRSCESLPAWQGHVVILDTLHYLAAAVQQQVLRDAAARVAPSAVLVIRSVLRDASWRFRVTRFEEFFMHAIRWMPRGALHYPALEELRVPLAEAGLTVEVRPLWGGTPFNSYLVVARRAA